MRRIREFSLALVLVLVTARPGVGQETLIPLPAIQRTDVEALHEKLVSLARAVPEELYDWRPMEGVRSFRDVFALLAAEAVAVPAGFGHPVPPDYAGDFIAEIRRVAGLPRDRIITELDEAFAHLTEVVAGLTPEQAERPTRFLGNPVTARNALLMSEMDLHEHLGQLVAYARMNQIVPPWSRGGAP